MRFTYRNYPLSKKLTNKSRSIAYLTQPLIAACVGMMPGLLCAFFLFGILPLPVLAVIMIAGVVVALKQAPKIREKKYAQLDAQYAKIQQNAK